MIICPRGFPFWKTRPLWALPRDGILELDRVLEPPFGTLGVLGNIHKRKHLEVAGVQVYMLRKILKVLIKI